jgi:hypothetical protein
LGISEEKVTGGHAVKVHLMFQGSLTLGKVVLQEELFQKGSVAFDAPRVA